MTTTPTIPDAAAAPGTTYVTVAIPYVNAAPHLGYAYELVDADVYARARRPPATTSASSAAPTTTRSRTCSPPRPPGVPTAEFVDAHAGALRRPRRAARHSSSTTSSARAPTRATHRRSSGCGGAARRPATCTGGPTRATTASGASGSTPPTSSSTAAAPSTCTRLERVAEDELVLPPVPPTGSTIERARSRRASCEITPAVPRRGAGVRARAGSTTSACRAPCDGRAAGASRCPTIRRRSSTSGSTRSPTTSASLDFGDPASAPYRRWWARRRPPGARDRQGHPALPRRVLAGVPAVGRAAGADADRGPPVPHGRRRQDLEVGAGQRRRRPVRRRRALRHRRAALVVRPRRVAPSPTPTSPSRGSSAGPTKTSPTGSATSSTASAASWPGDRRRRG